MHELSLINDLREQPWCGVVFIIALLAFGYQIVVALREGHVFDGAYTFDRAKSPFFFWTYLGFCGLLVLASAIPLALLVHAYVR